MARRIGRLEASHPPPCEECGYGTGEPVEGFAVEWAEEPDTEPEVCGKCGEPLVYVVTWGDEAGGE